MQERIEQLDGTLRILSTKPARGASSGTVIEARVPLTHLLPPDGHAQSDWEAQA